MRTPFYLWLEESQQAAAATGMLSLLLLLPTIFAQDESPVSCLQSGACFQVAFQILPLNCLCRAPMAPPRLDASMLPTREFGMQNRRQETGGADRQKTILTSLQVCGSCAP